MFLTTWEKLSGGVCLFFEAKRGPRATASGERWCNSTTPHNFYFIINLFIITSFIALLIYWLAVVDAIVKVWFLKCKGILCIVGQI
jgi:hypothetical protein